MGANKPNGFAGLAVEARRQVASLGGRKAQETGRAHRFTPEEARAAVTKRHEERRRRRAAWMASLSPA